MRGNSNIPRIAVVGDLMIDHYLWGDTNRISPEAPVPVVNIASESYALGGAGNVVSNLLAFGAKVDVISVIGDCENSVRLTRMLTEVNAGTDGLITQPDRIASKKSRIFASQQHVVRFDNETTDPIADEAADKLMKYFSQRLDTYDIVLLSDYGKGVLTPGLTEEIISISRQNGKRVLVDPKGTDYSKYKGAFLLTPNRKEASEATGIQIDSDERLEEAITKLKTELDLSVSLITLSSDGVAIYDEHLRKYPTVAREVFDVTGAGDTVLASLGFALSSGKDIDQSVEFANLAAGVVVGKLGSATASLAEIDRYRRSIGKQSSQENIRSREELVSVVADLKKRGKKIVFTNGCFDILHAGHVRYLEEARSYGDVLIVGVNSDTSVKRLKGSDRPVNNQADRAFILSALGCVNHVVIFEEDTPYELLSEVKPNVLVKGGDYKGKEVVGSDLVEEVRLVDFVEGKSTTGTIEKIQQL